MEFTESTVGARPTAAPKIHSLNAACSNGDVDALRELAVSKGGLLDDEVRRIAWPLLLGCATSHEDVKPNLKDLPAHSDEGQVQLDVDRSFVYYPRGESEEKRDSRKQELSKVIVTVLRRHPMLHYFQGYHDIVQVFLLVLGSDAAVNAVSRLSLLRIRDFMLPTMSGTEPHLRLLPAVLYAADPTLASHLSQTQPFFALPATLTLYAHEIEEYGQIARLFDFLLASEAVVSIYLFAVVVISRKDELLEIEADEPEMLHSILSRLPKPLDLDSLIVHTVTLFQKYPPEKLSGRAWPHISSNSVLKTTRHLHDPTKQTLADGERHFEKEAAEIRRHDALERTQKQARVLLRRYRRRATWTGTAVLFALLALYARSDTSPFATTWSSALAGMQRTLFDAWRRYLS